MGQKYLILNILRAQILVRLKIIANQANGAVKYLNSRQSGEREKEILKGMEGERGKLRQRKKTEREKGWR